MSFAVLFAIATLFALIAIFGLSYKLRGLKVALVATAAARRNAVSGNNLCNRQLDAKLIDSCDPLINLVYTVTQAINFYKAW